MQYHPELDLTPEEVIDYLRKSQSDDPTLSVEEVLEKHESILDRWAEEHLGGKVPEKNKFREVVSGETIKERPEINKLLRLIESPKYKAVKVVDPQRLTRGDLEDIGRLMKLFKLTNTLVIVPDEFGGQRIYDLRDEYDWDALERELKKGNDYLKYTKKILNRGRLLSVSQGNYLGSIAPYGYEKTTVKDGKRNCPTLRIKEDEANVVRMIFDMYVNKDMGRPSICYHLDELGIKPPKGERWSPAAMKDMLENIHYIGKVKWNWRKTVTIVEDSEIIHTRPKAKIGEYLIYDGRHDAIISEELFNAALKKNGKNPPLKKSAKIVNPLAGLVFCKCGRAMSLRLSKKKGVMPRLICDGQKYCQTGSCLHQEMVDLVANVLRQCIKDFDRRIENDTGDSAKLHAQLIKTLERKLKDLHAKELSQWESQSDPDPAKRMPQHIFQQLNEKLLKEKEEVQQALCKAYESMPEPVDYEERRKTFQDALDGLLNPDMDAQEKNRYLKRCIERIEYHREKPERIKSQQKRFYSPEHKKTISRSPLTTGGNWTSPPIELDVKLKFDHE